MARAILLVLDSFGLGATGDAGRFGDSGANTLGHIARACLDQRQGRPLALPNLARLGLLHAARAASGECPAGCELPRQVDGAWGHAAELSSGKDTPSGHWEMTGVPVLFEWGYFTAREDSFPPALLADLVREAGLPGVLGNCHASGTSIIEALGEAHIASGKPIVYTSADSVFQVAAHEQHFGLQRLYDICAIARRLLEPWNIGRVIARPFTGERPGEFRRTANRRDLAVPPPADTVLDALVAAGGEVWSIGKIADIFAHRGISRQIKADGNAALAEATLAALAEAPDNSIVFTNFVDFDTLYGHRRDPLGYAAALEAFDARLPAIEAALGTHDLLVLTADHGCDPTWPGSDHTREYVPVLARGAGLAAGSLGRRESFADIGASVAQLLGLPAPAYGHSFLQ